MLQQLLKIFGIKERIWNLESYDTFSGESYILPGSFSSEKAEIIAAQKELEKFAELQLSLDSGSQSPIDIQDRVYIIRPDGSNYRYLG